MKNSIKLITWLVGGLFTFSSCTDLDVDLKSTYTEYPDSEIAKEAKMAGLYYGFGGALGRRYMEAALLSSDEFMAVTFGGNWYDWRQLYPFLSSCQPSRRRTRGLGR